MNVRRVDGIIVTENVTFPRSGHKALRDVLRAYFGDAFHYNEPYIDPANTSDLNPQTNYQKNHDFTLLTPIKPDRQYLIQIRSLLPAIASRWKLEGYAYGPWAEVAPNWAFYYAGFVSRWLFRPVPRRLVVRYEELLANPPFHVAMVIRFLTGEQKVDSNKLAVALENNPIAPTPLNPIPGCPTSATGWRANWVGDWVI